MSECHRFHGSASGVVEKVVEDRVVFREGEEREECDHENEARAEDPIDRFFLVIEVHEDEGDEGGLGCCDGEAEDRVPCIEAVVTDIEGGHGGDEHGDDHSNCRRSGGDGGRSSQLHGEWFRGGG